MLRVVAVAAVGLAAGPVLAQDSSEEPARSLYRQGLQHYEKHRYRQAIDAFKRSYALSEKPALLFNIAQAHRLAGDCKAALGYYREYIAAEPNSPHKREVRQRIDEMEACLAPKPDGDAGLAPGSVSVATPRFDDDSGSTSEPPPPPPPVPDDPGQAKRAAGLVSAGVGIVLLGTSAYFGLRARSAADRVNELFQAGGEWTQEYRDLESQGKGDQSLAIVLGATGGAAVAAGVGLYVWGSREDVGIACVPGGATVTWAGTF